MSTPPAAGREVAATRAAATAVEQGEPHNPARPAPAPARRDGRGATHPTPRHPYGRCEDCGVGLEPDREGTFCLRCDTDDVFVTADGLRLRERRVPDLRRAREAQRVNQRAVWSLSGARA